jgi:ABC-type transporter Mla MlaB component
VTPPATDPKPAHRHARPGTREPVPTLNGPITPATVSELCDRLGAVLENTDAAVVTCDISSITQADTPALDGLARLQLAARRRGRSIRLCHPGRQLHDLLHLAGLSDIVPCCADPRAHQDQ